MTCSWCGWVGTAAEWQDHVAVHLAAVPPLVPPMYPPGLGRHPGMHTVGGKTRPGGVDVCSVCGERSDGLHDASLYAAAADFHNAARDLGLVLLIEVGKVLLPVLLRVQRWWHRG